MTTSYNKIIIKRWQFSTLQKLPIIISCHLYSNPEARWQNGSHYNSEITFFLFQLIINLVPPLFNCPMRRVPMTVHTLCFDGQNSRQEGGFDNHCGVFSLILPLKHTKWPLTGTASIWFKWGITIYVSRNGIGNFFLKNSNSSRLLKWKKENIITVISLKPILPLISGK